MHRVDEYGALDEEWQRLDSIGVDRCNHCPPGGRDSQSDSVQAIR